MTSAVSRPTGSSSGKSRCPHHYDAPGNRRVEGPLLFLFAALVPVLLCLAFGTHVAGAEEPGLAWTLQEEDPVADAGSDLYVTAGDRITLNGSMSTGFEGPENLNYTWTLRFPIGNVTLYEQTVFFKASQVGQLNVTLTVRDSLDRTDSDEMTVYVEEKRVSFMEKYWLFLLFGAAIGIPPGIWLMFALARVLRREPALPPTTREKVLLFMTSLRHIIRQYRKSIGGMLGLTILSFFLIMAIFAPYIAHFEDPKNIAWADSNPIRESPSSDYWFGTDFFGRDIWSLTVWGSRASLTVGILASLISIILGTSIGLSAGYFGKFSDEALMRLTDFFLVIPWLPLMIVFAMVMGRSFTNIIIVIGITSWPSTARIVRAQVLSIKEKMFVQRAICIGAGDFRIIGRHVLPNVVPLIFANTILLIANSIFSESFLEFFNLGDPDVISWGTMLEESYSNGDFNSVAWWDYAFPGGCIVILIMAFYLIGDALDEVLNPKLRRR